MFYKQNSIKKYIIILALLTQTLLFSSAEALSWLNKFRKEAKMTEYTTNANLNLSASSHANFITTNNIGGHYEKKGFPGFTGVTPSDRTLQAGYKTTFVGENVSSGGSSLKTQAHSSIVGLFSAIYHRFGFLSFNKDEVGIGSSDNSYVYNMGNKKIEQLCKSSTLTSGWTVCANNIALSTKDFNEAKDNTKKQNPPYVIYPPDGQVNTYPAFFTESPHPLPGSNVSGFPISISFNDYYIASADVSRIDVFDPSGQKIDGLFMTKNNDPNSKFSDLEYAFFPTLRLSYSTIYNVEIQYSLTPKETYKGETKGVFKTSFTTEVPKEHIYRLDDFPNNEIPVISGKKYLVYYQPKHNNDLPYSQINASYAGISSQDLKAVDGNLFTLQVSGSEGGYITITGKGKKTKFYISQTDKPNLPLQGKVAVSKQPETQNTQASKPNITEADKELTANITFNKGWNLLVSPINKKISSTQDDGYKMDSFGDAKIYIMQNGELSLNSSDINIGQGFFIHAKQSGSSNEATGKTYSFTQSIKQGWNILGLSIASSNPKKDLKLKDSDTLFVHRNGKYIKNPTSINSGEGFLIFRK